MPIQLSLVIPAKDNSDPKLKQLFKSIDAQDFPKEELEILVVTEGTSESSKAIGIKKARGKVIGLLASDNELVEPYSLSGLYQQALCGRRASFQTYYYDKKDNALNRYFALMGCNDPLAWYMKKNDKESYIDDNHVDTDNGTLGDNGFFVLRDSIMKTDLDNYYHIDNANECEGELFTSYSIWHKTGGNLFKFLAKRYRYGLQHAFNSNRRWHLVDFRRGGDILKLAWFVIASLSIIHPLILSIRGYRKIKDKAWFLHPVMCVLTVFTYSSLVIHLGAKRLFRLLYAHSVGRLL